MPPDILHAGEALAFSREGFRSRVGSLITDLSPANTRLQSVGRRVLVGRLSGRASADPCGECGRPASPDTPFSRRTVSQISRRCLADVSRGASVGGYSIIEWKWSPSALTALISTSGAMVAA